MGRQPMSDEYRIHNGDPGPQGTDNLSGGDPTARPLGATWNNPTNYVETITHVSVWRDGHFTEAKALSVGKFWGAAWLEGFPEGDTFTLRGV